MIIYNKIIRYIFHIVIVKVGQAGKGFAMQDIPGKWFVEVFGAFPAHLAANALCACNDALH
jgi:hypothetical protein